jgi:hypothetical protein
MKLTAWQFFTNQRKTVPPVLVADLTSKTILVTGANTGLGYEAAKHFANMKPGKLIIACRSKSKGDEAVAREFTFYDPIGTYHRNHCIGRSTQGDGLFKRSAAPIGLGELCFCGRIFGQV